MNIEKIQKAMKKYGVAWGKQDTELLLSCFTKDGVYQISYLNEYWNTRRIR